MTPRPPRHPNLPARLGWVSFLNDASSEVVGRILPLVLTGASGVAPAFVGLVEGFADAVAIFLKGLSGWLSDRARSRKGFVLTGYGISVMGRSLYLFALLPGLLGTARILDRIGKGIRSAPRDALVADAAAQGQSGKAFGITRFLDTLGSMTGIALVLLLGLGQSSDPLSLFRQAAWIALPLGLGALALIQFGIPRIERIVKVPRRLSWQVPREVRSYLALVFLFGLANSSDAFLVLKAREEGFALREILLLFLAFHGLAALLAVPAGRLSDRLGRWPFLVAGWSVYAAAYLAIGVWDSKVVFSGSLLAYGAFYGLTEGVEKALLADLLQPEHRGMGFGAFQTATGIAALVASPLMGLAMGAFGSRKAFMACGLLAFCAAALMGVWGRRRDSTASGAA